MDKINVRSLHKSLNDRGYICDVPFSASLLTSMKAKPVGGAFLYGLAGTGKSYLPQVLSEVVGCPIYVHQCTTGTREEELLVKMMPSETSKSGVVAEHGKLYQAALKSKKSRVILMLDEWDKTRPTADAFFLDFLQYGRLSIPGHNIQANLDNMLIFITANDEREFMEALLRRFPKIDVQPLSMNCIKKALELTHKGHKFLPHCMELYARCLMSEMTKPATIQELRQLMDSISELGSGADWDSLVYQFVTKTPENHALLKQFENVELKGDFAIARDKINSKSFGKSLKEHFKDAQSDDKFTPLMPRLVDINKFESTFKAAPVPDKELYGIFKRTDASESHMFTQNISADNDPELPAFLEWATITDDVVYMHKEVNCKGIYSLQQLATVLAKSSEEGEVRIVDKFVTRKELNRMLAGKWMVKKRDANEIIARKWINNSSGNTCKVDLRYTDEKGLEIIADVMVGEYLVDSIFKLNKYDNLLRISVAENIAVSYYLNRVNHAVPYELNRMIRKRGYGNGVGLSQIKALSEGHKGFCDMLVPCNYNGRQGSISDDEVEYYEDLVNCKGIKVTRGALCGDGVSFEGRNIKLESINIGEGSNSGLWVRITGLPDINLLNFAVLWADCVPLYRCRKIKPQYRDGVLFSRLANKNGWLLVSTNTNALEKNGVYALFAGDYVVFCTFIDQETLSWSARAGALISNKLNSIKRCVANYCDE